VICPENIKRAIKLLISANSFLLPAAVDVVEAIIETFCNCNHEMIIG